MKHVLGFDLGTTSIGWALVREGEKEGEVSGIIKAGVRVIPLSTDEKQNFETGKPQETNTQRTLKRSMRRNMHRYKLRRRALIATLKEIGFIKGNTALTETGQGSTHETWRLRAKAATDRIEKEEFARVLLAINKKRGYKSNRKAKDSDEGEAIDNMAVAKELAESGLTPGQFAFQLLSKGKKSLPDFYRSDLKAEFDKVWAVQSQFYPEILTDKLYKELEGKNKKQTWAICKEPFNIVGIKRTTKGLEQKKETYKWRASAISEKLDLEHLVIVLQEINNDLNKSSGYLGNISDRSKELYFNNMTVGQYLYQRLKKDFHAPLTNMVFYRQDYLDEFERIWETQAKFYPELKDEELKKKIRDNIIFYQRRLKSKKSLVSLCELESREVDRVKDGKKKRVLIGPRVAPKSSPLFQEFKILQILNNLKFTHVESLQEIVFKELDDEVRQFILDELTIKGGMKSTDVLKLIGKKYKIGKPAKYISNYEKVEGNNTVQDIYSAFQKILESEGYGFDWNKKSAAQIREEVHAVFEQLNIDTSLLDFNMDRQNPEQAGGYQFWHLLYSAEEDPDNLPEELIFKYGKTNTLLKKLLFEKYRFKPEHSKHLVNIAFKDDYGSLSAKAIKKILPFLRAGHEYSEAAMLAGYNHSHSKTKEELQTRELEDRLEILPKNALRNPVVEKILNQMIHVLNTVIDKHGKPDEVRIEMSRELKASIKERQNRTRSINEAKKRHEAIRKMLQSEFGIKNPTRNDIIKYKLYEELAPIGYHTVFTNKYIPKEKLFSKEIDIEHIIPKAMLFDDSFSNKTLAYRDVNIKKANRTALDFITDDYHEDLDNYKNRIASLYKGGKGTISTAKWKKLLMTRENIPENFLERDLRNTQYISKKAKQLLEKVIRTVNTTSGSITAKLREDWDLIGLMKELNMPKYEAAGMVEYQERKNGQRVKIIKDWTKRDDHRHHAMDALTVAFTTRSHVQYLNNLNALNEKNVEGEVKHHLSKLYGIKEKITEVIRSNGQKGKRRFKKPFPGFREEAKKHLESILVSFKAKNKVTTPRKNKITGVPPEKYKTEQTPRGQLHEETIYGKIKRPKTKEVKVNKDMNAARIRQVTQPAYRQALEKRLEAFGGDPQKAFAGKNALKKNPIILDEASGKTLPEKVTILEQEDVFTIRKPIEPSLKIEKVIDKKIQEILRRRLDQYNGDAKKAFGDLDKNPIWLNKEKGISIKRVTIRGFYQSIGENTLHAKKDHQGNLILNSGGNPVPVDYVALGNNHHIAIYQSPDGKLHEQAVSFFEAVTRKLQGVPVIDKDYKKEEGWKFVFTLKQNEMFVFPGADFNPWEVDLKDPANAPLIAKHLFRVQKISSGNYMFTHQTETKAINNDTLKNKGLKGIKFYHIQSTKHLYDLIKVRTNHLGEIVEVLGGIPAPDK